MFHFIFSMRVAQVQARIAAYQNLNQYVNYPARFCADLF